MGYQERDYQKRMSLAQTRHALITLIAVNLIFFVILAFVKALYSLRYGATGLSAVNFQENVVSLFALPADFNKIATHPWTILTHMFIHIDVWHIIGNML